MVIFGEAAGEDPGEVLSAEFFAKFGMLHEKEVINRGNAASVYLRWEVTCGGMKGVNKACQEFNGGEAQISPCLNQYGSRNAVVTDPDAGVFQEWEVWYRVAQRVQEEDEFKWRFKGEHFLEEIIRIITDAGFRG